MFGYVKIDKPELKVKDYECYRAYYCGLCHTLKKRGGLSAQLTLTYDMTFLILVLTSLYEPETANSVHSCIAHPFKKRAFLENRYTEYAADMNLVLMYLKCMDDWKDEKKPERLAFAALLKKQYKKIRRRYPRQCAVIEEALKALAESEKEQERNLDVVAGHFGRLMAELFVVEEDVWAKELRTLGFALGKYIYLLDAYEDLEQDKRKGSYNPLLFWEEELSKEQYEEMVEQALLLLMAEGAAAFERLPCLLHVDILRNILYEGVWKAHKQKRGNEEP